MTSTPVKQQPPSVSDQLLALLTSRGLLNNNTINQQQQRQHSPIQQQPHNTSKIQEEPPQIQLNQKPLALQQLQQQQHQQQQMQQQQQSQQIQHQQNQQHQQVNWQLQAKQQQQQQQHHHQLMPYDGYNGGATSSAGFHQSMNTSYAGSCPNDVSSASASNIHNVSQGSLLNVSGQQLVDYTSMLNNSGNSAQISMNYVKDLMATLSANPNLARNLYGQAVAPNLGPIPVLQSPNTSSIFTSPVLNSAPQQQSGNSGFDEKTLLESSDFRSRVNAANNSLYGNLFSTNNADPFSIEKAARLYRNAAAVCDATCTWSGQLPPRNYKNPIYSCKVFVGGVPWDISESTLVQAFKVFGPVHVEWPGREARYARAGVKPSAKGKGYVYMIFDCEKSVKALIQNCNRDYSNTGDWYFKLTTRRLRTKEIRQVQIIPWIIGDSTFVRCNNQRMDPHKTVFIGALHGMITSEVLATVMNDLFGGVIYAAVDTDKYKYPIGSGRVTFNNQKSYFKAVTSAFVEVKTTKFNKKVQIDPFLEDSACSMCNTTQGPYFCRELMCFRYFCKSCWQGQHGTLEAMRYHKPLMRNTRVTTRREEVMSSTPVQPQQIVISPSALISQPPPQTQTMIPAQVGNTSISLASLFSQTSVPPPNTGVPHGNNAPKPATNVLTPILGAGAQMATTSSSNSSWPYNVYNTSFNTSMG